MKDKIQKGLRIKELYVCVSCIQLVMLEIMPVILIYISNMNTMYVIDLLWLIKELWRLELQKSTRNDQQIYFAKHDFEVDDSVLKEQEYNKEE